MHTVGILALLLDMLHGRLVPVLLVQDHGLVLRAGQRQTDDRRAGGHDEHALDRVLVFERGVEDGRRAPHGGTDHLLRVGCICADWRCDVHDCIDSYDCLIESTVLEDTYCVSIYYVDTLLSRMP